MKSRSASVTKSVPVAELAERDVLAALLSREECAALLTRIAARPPARSGALPLLALLGQLATPACTWLDGGDLAVELFDEEGLTKVRVMSELGAGLRERMLPVVTIDHPLDELAATFEESGDLVARLRLERVSSRCVMLVSAEAESAPTSMAFDISETSLAWSTSTGADDVDSGWDDTSSSQTT
jgi:hypothetical protein